MFYTYVLKNDQGKLYIGYSSDLRKRLSEHKNKKVYTTKRLGGNWQLIYYEACQNKYGALKRERYLKSGPGLRYLKQRLKNY